MPVTNFYTVEGEIIGEKTAGSPRIDYLTDALGSVTATVNQSAQVVNTYRYKPFGALLAKTGTGADAAFGWVGTQGYRPTQRRFSEHYMEARHYADTLGRWPNVDPIGIRIGLSLYDYVMANPALLNDPSGLSPCPKLPPAICWSCEYHRFYWGIRHGDKKAECAMAAKICGGKPEGIDCDDPPHLPEPAKLLPQPPPGPNPPASPGTPPGRGRCFFPGPPDIKPKPIGNPGPIDWIPLPVRTNPLPIPFYGWCQITNDAWRVGIQEACSAEPGNSLAGVASPGAAGGITCAKIQTMIKNLLAQRCTFEQPEDAAFCKDLEQKEVAWAAWCAGLLPKG